MLSRDVRVLADAVRDWARAHADVTAVALVGSHARGVARPDSDIDFVVLTTAPESYRVDTSWPAQIAWPSHCTARADWMDASYGALWSRHLELTDGTRVEIGFAAPSWAQLVPVDAGTVAVLRGGCEVLWDPERLLAGLLHAVDVLPDPPTI